MERLFEDSSAQKVFNAGGAFNANSKSGGEGHTNVWLTPRHVIEALGPFDLDPCAATVRPWDCAATNWTVENDGFNREWAGLVWLNPPYGKRIGDWLAKLAKHGNGIALTFVRSDTAWFQSALRYSSCQLWLAGRLSFIRPNGAKSDGGVAPSVFLAFGEQAAKRLYKSPLVGVRTGYKRERVGDRR